MLAEVIRLLDRASKVMAGAGPDAGGQDCEGALIDGKAPIGTRLLRPSGSKHHSEKRPTDQTQDTEGQPEYGSDRLPERHIIILTARVVRPVTGPRQSVDRC